MTADRDEVVAVLVRSIKLLAIGLAINALPGLIPYRLISSEFGDAMATITWIVRLVGIIFLIAAARVAASAGAPSHG